MFRVSNPWNDLWLSGHWFQVNIQKVLFLNPLHFCLHGKMLGNDLHEVSWEVGLMGWLIEFLGKHAKIFSLLTEDHGLEECQGGIICKFMLIL